MPRRRLMTRLAASVAALAAAAAAAGCGGTSKAQPPAPPAYAGNPLTQQQPAPPTTLRNYDGRQIDLSQYRGKAVLLTFIYTHCPDICPTITANLHNALAKLGPAASKAQVVAISADPRGDTPASIRHFLAAHE